jgi:hypothetical protein
MGPERLGLENCAHAVANGFTFCMVTTRPYHQQQFCGGIAYGFGRRSEGIVERR